MTIEKAIKELEDLRHLALTQRANDAILMAIAALRKENEPASSANDTSSKENYYNKNDSTEKKKCQEAITAAVNSMCDIYNEMSEEEQRAWELGEVYKRVLDVQRMIEEDRQC